MQLPWMHLLRFMHMLKKLMQDAGFEILELFVTEDIDKMPWRRYIIINRSHQA